MIRTLSLTRSTPALRPGLVGLAALLLVAATAAADLGDPAIATSGRIEDHMAESESLEDRVAEPEDLDEHEGRSRGPSSLTTGSERLEDHETNSQDVADHEAQSRAPEELGPAGIGRGFESIELPGQAEWEPTTDPELIVARRRLERAQEKARAARARYGEMRKNDYPRGAARIRIVEARDAAEKELEEAKAALLAAEDDAPAAVGR